jgi:hypothetical protein
MRDFIISLAPSTHSLNCGSSTREAGELILCPQVAELHDGCDGGRSYHDEGTKSGSGA